MSNVGYDLDTSGGLMPLIRALIKPPDEDVNTQKPKKPQHPYYKRPGKGHNHDSCDACGEGGDLICCDRCPASFHLGCYDPPLDENDIPAGLWLCRECRASDAEKPASSRSSRAQSPVDSKSDNEKKTRSLRKNSTNSAKKRIKDEEEEEEEETKESEELTPMEILVKAAKIMNPRQFELPREMRIPCLFPGTDKEGNKNGNPSLVTVDAWGCVPMPARSCFVCQGTCKMAPLLQCDYCPLLFHQDCLDPPLTALPTGRWMCPNHVEQYIDWKLVNSISATERVALWEKFSGPVDQHAIKVDFIRRARKARPAFRMKAPAGVRGRVAVPGMVRAHYARPPPLLPARREHVRCAAVLKKLKASEAYEESEDEDVPKHTICMNLSCPSYSRAGPCGRAPAALCGASREDAAGDLRDIARPEVEQHTDSSSELSDSDFEYLTAAVKRRRVSTEAGPGAGAGLGAGAGGARGERLELRLDEEAAQLLAAVDDQLQKLDERLVKLLAWQRLQQVALGEQCYGAWRGAPLPESVARAARVAACRAWRGARGALPSDLLSRADRERIARRVWGAAPAACRAPRVPPAAPAARVRAALCAVPRLARNGLGDVLGRPIPMRLSSLWVGTDSGCDVRLDAATCRCVSRNHAVIFMDEVDDLGYFTAVSRHFELINYSEWGSQVNGVLFACDVTRGSASPDAGHAGGAQPGGAPAGGAQPGGAPAGGEAGAGEAEARAAALRDIVRHRLPAPQRLNGNLTLPTAGDPPCRCPPPRAPGGAGAGPGGAWEGSALVPHGALLQFGCLMYVFSITDHKTFPYEESNDDPAI